MKAGILVVAPQPQPTVVDRHVTIKERRAPTDESVKLLREMEDAAERRVLESIKVGDTAFECVLHRATDQLSGDDMTVAIFSLNGAKYRAEARCARGNRNELLERLVSAVSDRIAREVVRRALLKMPEAWR